MKKEIYIHVGAGKTGTSAIQEFLFLNEDRLSRMGLCIPNIGRDKSKSFLFHHHLAGGREREIDNEKTYALWKQVARLKESKILVTSEIFHSRITYKKTKEIFSKIKKILYDFNIKIIFYIRRDEQWIQSAYEQWIKSGTKRDGETLSNFVKKPKTSLGEQIYLFSDIFGKENMIIRPFERKQFFKGDIFNDFCHTLEIELDENFIYPARNPNPRLSLDALEFKRIYNTVCTDKAEAELITPLLKKYSALVDQQSTSLFRKANLLSLEDRNIIYEKNKKLYQEIAKDFLSRPDGKLFFEDNSDEQVKYEFNIKDLTKITSFLFLRMSKKIDKLSRSLGQVEEYILMQKTKK